MKFARQETAAKEEVRQAQAEQAEGERVAKLEAQAARDNEAKERRYAEAVADFVKDDFLALTSVEGQSRFGGEELTKDATLHDLLDRAAEKLKQRQDLEPRIEAELNWIIGVSYRGTGDYEGMKKHEAQISTVEKNQLTEAVERLVRLYQATKNEEAANKWQRVLDAISQ